MSNRSKLRAAVKAAASPPADAAGVELAGLLADLLDRSTPRTLTQIAAGQKPLSLEDQLEVVRIVGPQYLRTLTALGLTRLGRGVRTAGHGLRQDAPAEPTGEQAAHDAQRQRFSERAAGA